MLWRLWLSVLLGMATIVGQVDSNQGLQAAEPPGRVEADVGDSLLLRNQTVQFCLVLGRLELDPPRYRKGSKSEERLEPTPLRESFAVTADRGIPSLHYTRSTPTWEMVLDVVAADRVQILSTLLEADEHLCLTQPARGPLLVRLRSAGTEKSFHSPSWLHLHATHPEVFARHLDPLLACLLPSLSLQQLREDATARLLRLASHTRPPKHEELRELIDRLNARQRRERDRAHAKLLDYGILIVPFLDQLPRRELQQEQRLRIDAIREQLRPRKTDAPSGVAHWLIADPDYWNAIATDLSDEQQLVANRHLQRIQDEGLNPDNEGSTRVAQTPESSNRK